jgi:hypothetical protein
MFRLLHLECAGLAYIEGTRLLAYAALTTDRNYGDAPNYNDVNYFKRVFIYETDTFLLKRELLFQEPYEDSTSQIRSMTHIPHTNHLAVGTEGDRKIYFFDINSPIDTPFNVIDLSLHSTTTSEVWHLRGWS